MADRRDKDEDEIPELPGFEAGDYADEIPELGEYQEAPERSFLDTAGDLLSGVNEGGSFGGWNPIKSGPLEGVRPALELASTVAPTLSMLRDGPTGDLIEQLLTARDKRAQEASGTVAGQAGEALGAAGSAAGLGVAAGPGLAAQAGAGAASSAAQAAQESGGDPLAMLAAGGSGAAFGLGGGLAGKAFDSVAGAAPLLQKIPRPSAMQWTDSPLRSARRAMVRGLGNRRFSEGLETAGQVARGAGQAGAAGIGRIEGMFGKAGAQDVAYAGAPTVAWAVQSVLTSGSGLPPADEQRLTEAVLEGDTDKLISANFALSQKFPGYAARIRAELAGLREED